MLHTSVEPNSWCSCPQWGIVQNCPHMNKYVQRLSVTQRKHCLGTGQLTVVGKQKSENTTLRKYKHRGSQALNTELHSLFVDIFRGYCGHQLTQSCPSVWHQTLHCCSGMVPHYTAISGGENEWSGFGVWFWLHNLALLATESMVIK